MSGREEISASVFASSVLPTPAGPSIRTGRPMRDARYTTVEMRRVAMYLAAWLGDQVKAVVLSSLVSLAALEVVYGLLRVSPEWWWLAATAVFLVAIVMIAVVLPVWIVPLFYRLTPLEDETLRARLLALA